MKSLILCGQNSAWYRRWCLLVRQPDKAGFTVLINNIPSIPEISDKRYKKKPRARPWGGKEGAG